jgi:hypothetical protein
LDGDAADPPSYWLAEGLMAGSLTNLLMHSMMLRKVA